MLWDWLKDIRTDVRHRKLKFDILMDKNFKANKNVIKIGVYEECAHVKL